MTDPVLDTSCFSAREARSPIAERPGAAERTLVLHAPHGFLGRLRHVTIFVAALVNNAGTHARHPAFAALARLDHRLKPDLFLVRGALKRFALLR